jgi:hypothetical protein
MWSNAMTGSATVLGCAARRSVEASGEDVE